MRAPDVSSAPDRASHRSSAAHRPRGRSLTFALATVAALTMVTMANGRPAGAAPSTPSAGDGATAVGVSHGERGWVLRDGDGREVVLRGFNVSGGTKLYENGLLPFRDTADAVKSAQAMRDQTGANAVRFLISWEGVQPDPGRVDYAYLDRAIDQMTAFTDRGIRVLLDYHQDLYSSHLFNSGSWYTGDGAPKWVIDAGDYPRESCGICLMWGQNMMSNAAVRQAMHDFWHNRRIDTPAGRIGVQDAYVSQAAAAMTYVRQRLSAAQFESVVGLDPFNEPFDGGLDGKSGVAWEKDLLLPFYQRIRAAMDTAGWAAKPAFVEPLVFWNTGFFEEGGMSAVGTLGSRYVFNSHFYDGGRMTVDPTPAGDGVYDSAMNEIRDRARTLATAPLVSEFGNKLSGGGGDRTPWMVRAMYQAMDYGVAGHDWWEKAESGGTVLSSTQWHWDIYSGRHHELMNGNPGKVQTEGDGWNDEDFSLTRTDDAGAVELRLDQRVLDRLYPTAVTGDTLAFAYEDLARSGYGGAGRQQPWLAAPSAMPAVATLVKDRQFGVLVWREPGTPAGTPTELHLPRSFAPASTVVVSDVDTRAGLPATGAVRTGQEIGSATARRLMITPAGGASGGVHFALVVNAGSGPPVTDDELAAANGELTGWANRRFATN